MISKTIGFRGTLFSDKLKWHWKQEGTWKEQVRKVASAKMQLQFTTNIHQSSISNLKNLKIQSGHSRLCLCCFPEPMACPQLQKGWLPGVDPDRSSEKMAQRTTLHQLTASSKQFSAETHDGSMVLVYILTLFGGILMGSMEHHIYIYIAAPWIRHGKWVI